MTEHDLAMIEARAHAATPGPWEWIGGETFVVDREYAPIYTDLESETAWIISCGIQQQGKVSSGCMAIRETDAAFIAAARADVPALVAEVRRSQAGIIALRLAHKENETGDPYFDWVTCSVIRYGTRCDCGADAHNAKIDALLGPQT